MYYSYYLNERMLLDNWSSYNEGNWLLKQLLFTDSRKTVEEKIEYYLAHKKVKDVAFAEYYESDDFQQHYNQYLYEKDMHEMYLEDYGEENDVMAYVEFTPNAFYENYSRMKEYDDQLEAIFTKGTIRNAKLKKKLREVKEVVLYKSDILAAEEARKKYRLTELQSDILVGLIFFSRMNDCKYARVGTEFKFKQFKGCFKRTIKEEDIEAVLSTGLFNLYVNEKKDIKNDYYNYKAEKDYEYLGYDNKDEVGFIYKVTPKNNKLSLTGIHKVIIPNSDKKRCERCGNDFSPKNNRQKFCSTCQTEVRKEQARERKRRQREREKLK